MFTQAVGKWVALPVAAVLLLAGVRAAEPLRADEDPLPVDSQWKGKLTQGGKTPGGAFFPPELNSVLTVTYRSGNDFEAELHEYSDSLNITYLVRGTIAQESDKSLVIRFRSHGIKGAANAGMYFLSVPYTARFTGDSVKGTWSYDDKDTDVALEGSFNFKRSDE
jgi:hypothetical protein